MRRLIPLLGLVLLFPAAAQAKELKAAKACGSSDCVDVTKLDWRDAPVGGDTPTEAPPPSPYYTVTFVVGEPGTQREEGRFTMYYVPTRHLVAGNGIVPGDLSWFPVVGSTANGWVEQATAGLIPFPAPRRWPHEIQSPQKLRRAAGTKAEATPVANRKTPIAAADDGGVWSIWFVLPILGVGIAGAAGFELHRRRHGG